MGRHDRTVGILMALQAVGVLAVALFGARTTRAVTVTLADQPTTVLSRVDVGVAMVVVLALSAAAWALSTRWSVALDPLLTTPVAVFVVAQLNGVRDVGALVGIYALASAGVLFALVQRRQDHALDGSRVPLGLGSAVGIVPWGIIAFHQVGAGVVGHPLPGIVVAITLTALAFAIAEFVATWRRRPTAAALLRTAGSSAVAWMVAAAL